MIRGEHSWLGNNYVACIICSLWRDGRAVDCTGFRQNLGKTRFRGGLFVMDTSVTGAWRGTGGGESGAILIFECFFGVNLKEKKRKVSLFALE